MKKLSPIGIGASALRFIRRIGTDRRGNVLIILGFSMVPLVLATGFAIDYSRAMKLRTRMNAAADAAALAGVSVAMMQINDDTPAKTAATNMFNAQIAGLQGMVFASGSTNPNVQVSSTGGVNNRRTVTVSYTAASTNLFGGILGAATLPVNGSATASATRAPNINFFLMMDVSPSMLLPVTTDGINSMVGATTQRLALSSGCAFACHTQNAQSDKIYIRNQFDSAMTTTQANTWLDNSGNSCVATAYTPKTGNVTCGNGKTYQISNGMFIDTIWLDSSGSWCPVKILTTTNITCENGTKYNISNGQVADGYWLTRNFTSVYGKDNISLRIDEEQTAAQKLIPFAVTTAANNQVTYKLQLFTFDWTGPSSSATSPVATITNSMQDVSSMTSYTVPNFYSTQDNWYKNNCPTSSLCSNNDKGTEIHNSLIAMNKIMPDPGDGSSSNSPQEVLFIITDGLSDELYSSSRWNREFNATNLADCTAIKNRGIRIAILYTEYLPASIAGDAWSQINVAPYLSKIEPALQSCASPGADGVTPLYYKVTTDQSISDALTTLFALTVQNAHLTF